MDVKYSPVVSQEVELGTEENGKLETATQIIGKHSGVTAASDSDFKPEPSQRAIAAAVALYAACSSTLLVINKVAVHLIPDPSFVLFCQFLSSCVFVRLLKVIRPEMDIELLNAQKAWKFAIAAIIFFICLLSNTQALKSVNVETVIVVRSLSPIAVAILDRIALGRPLPEARAQAALLLIACGAVIYVATDAGFVVSGYAWVSVYFLFIVIEMVFVKFVLETLPMSTWTRVYYNNALGLPLAAVSCFATGGGELAFLRNEWTLGAVAALLLSCVVGIAISYAGFNLRNMISATSFTVVGVVCKLATVLINDMIWTKHANFWGHCGLFICLEAGFLYERAKKKK